MHRILPAIGAAILLTSLARGAIAATSPEETLRDLKPRCDFTTPAMRDYVAGDTDDDTSPGFPTIAKTRDCVEGLRDALTDEDGRLLEDDPLLDDPSVPADLMIWANRSLARAEGVLRRSADLKLALIENLQATADNPQAAEAEKQSARRKIGRLDKGVREIDDLVAYSRKKQIVNFEDYDDYFFRFPVGYEILQDDPSLEKGFPRVGFLVSALLGGGQVHDLVHGRRLGRYGAFLSFTAQITSSAEQTIETFSGNPAGGDDGPMEPPPGDGSQEDGGEEGEDDGEDDQPTVDGEPVEDAFEFEVQLYLPVFRSRAMTPEGLRVYIGPILTVGGKQIEAADEVEGRHYGGLRIASNPELYWDLLVGKSDGLDGKRLEVRGQLPIHIFEGGNRLFLGAIGNFGLDGEDEPDVIRLYVTWNVDVKELFNGRL